MNNMDRYKAEMIETKKIFADHKFNCRGRIDSGDCKELSASIAEHGLEFPIHLQPYKGKPGYEYRIISGHRRFTACKLLNWTEIPCIVRTDITDEGKAKDLNIIENIHRRDLNILQEAKALTYYILNGHTVGQIGTKIGKSIPWVEIRRRLIMLPKFVQDAAENGTINQGHINQFWAHKNNPEKMSEMIRKIKDLYDKGESVKLKEVADIKELVRVRKPKPHEVQEFLFSVANSLTNQMSEDIDCFAHKVLAWICGYQSTSQVYQALEAECQLQGTEYRPPHDIAEAMKNVTKTKAVAS